MNVNDEAKPKRRTLDYALLNATKEPVREEKPEKKKRGRGRPRKEPIVAPVDDPALQSDPDADYGQKDEEEAGLWNQVFGGTGEDDEESVDEATVNVEQKTQLMSTILALRTEFKVKGSGMVPQVAHTTAQLQTEMKLCNDEINMRRADESVKALIMMALPFIEGFSKKMFDPTQFDLTGFKEEVADNFCIIEGACKQISILHRNKFAISPYSTVGQGLLMCANTCNAKNQMRRQAATMESTAEDNL